MKLRLSAGIVFALAACGGGKGGGGAAGPEEPAPTAEPTPFEQAEALYDRCGMSTTKDIAESGMLDKPEEELTEEEHAMLARDPASQTPADVDACMEFVRWVMEDRTDTNQIVGAGDLSYALCFGETGSGEACYYHALYWQIPVWNGGGDEYTAGSVTMWLGESCTFGYAQACAILETGSDDQGRAWSVEAPPSEEPPVDEW